VGHRVGRIVGILAAALVGTTLDTTPATADVSVTPTQAVRGGAVKLTFQVPEDRAPAYTTQIEVRLPEATPVAEAYPMSVPDWAPRMTMRRLAQPLDGLHGGRITEVVAAITWTRADGAPRSGRPAELTISLGPLPEADRMVFAVRQTYSDGLVTNWDEVAPREGGSPPARPAPVLTLLPAATAPSPSGAGSDTGTEAREAGPAGDGSGGFGSLAVGSAAGLVAAAALGAWLLLRRRDDARPDRDRRPGRAWRLRE